jgi:cytochrome P450
MQILQLHELYGDVVRIRPNELSFIDPNAWKDIKGQKKAGQEENGKDPAIVASPGLRDSILGADRDTHARFRRALAPGFSFKAMLAQEPLIQSYVDLLMRKLKLQCNDGKTPVDLRNWFNYFTFDLIGDLSFGEPFDCLINANYHPWVSIIIHVMQALLFIGIVRRFVPAFDRISAALTPKRIAEGTARHGQFTHEKVSKRLALSTSRADFIDAILAEDEQNSDAKLTMAEIESNASVLIVAGSETSATVLAASAYHLAMCPDVLNCLAKEIRTSFKSESDITIVGVGHLKYLNAVVEESLRAYPPAPWSQPRVIRRGGDIIAGYVVPEGVSFPVDIIDESV